MLLGLARRTARQIEKVSRFYTRSRRTTHGRYNLHHLSFHGGNRDKSRRYRCLTGLGVVDAHRRAVLRLVIMAVGARVRPHGPAIIRDLHHLALRTTSCQRHRALQGKGGVGLTW